MIEKYNNERIKKLEELLKSGRVERDAPKIRKKLKEIRDYNKAKAFAEEKEFLIRHNLGTYFLTNEKEIVKIVKEHDYGKKREEVKQELKAKSLIEAKVLIQKKALRNKKLMDKKNKGKNQ